jgi:hypothetical protein
MECNEQKTTAKSDPLCLSRACTHLYNLRLIVPYEPNIAVHAITGSAYINDLALILVAIPAALIALQDPAHSETFNNPEPQKSSYSKGLTRIFNYSEQLSTLPLLQESRPKIQITHHPSYLSG